MKVKLTSAPVEGAANKACCVYLAKIFGVAKGSVKVLSATTFIDEKDKQPFYKAIISLEEGHVGQGDKHRMILPGMVVQANIITGSKSLVKYLLKPVYRSLDRAFSER